MTSKETEDKSVLQQIVPNGLCIGCGMCAGILPDVLRMQTDRYGAYLPELTAPSAHGWGPESLQVCPFADNPDNEDAIAAALFGATAGIQHRPETGFYLKCFVGHVVDEETRLASTSGGIITWLASELLSRGQVDAVACVGEAQAGPNLFEFQLVTDPGGLARCRKSRYYAVEVSSIIPQIKRARGKVLFIGLPCFLKALRLAMNVDAELRDRIGGTIGLVCGHLKTKKYCAYLARYCGVSEHEIQTADFRVKVPGQPAHKYAFSVRTRDKGAGSTRQVLMENVWARSWSNNLFMLDACECCDDVIAETADVVVGDAWLSEYVRDYRGTSVVLCRTQQMLDLLQEGVRAGQLSLEDIPVEPIIRSQAGALRQRREGLQYRLALCAKRHQWRPQKRVPPDPRAGTMLFRWLQRLRIKLKTLSKEAFLAQEGREGLDLFKRRLRPWVKASHLINMLRHSPTVLKRKLARLIGRPTRVKK